MTTYTLPYSNYYPHGFTIDGWIYYSRMGSPGFSCGNHRIRREYCFRCQGLRNLERLNICRLLRFTDWRSCLGWRVFPLETGPQWRNPVALGSNLSKLFPSDRILDPFPPLVKWPVKVSQSCYHLYVLGRLLIFSDFGDYSQHCDYLWSYSYGSLSRSYLRLPHHHYLGSTCWDQKFHLPTVWIHHHFYHWR